MRPLVSIVIPAKNEEFDLPRAIAWVVSQDYDHQRMEVVVVDGDSTDGTARVAKALLEAEGFHRWGVVANSGGNTPSNLNKGLEWAQGEFIVRVDARSEVPSDYVRRTTTVLVDRPEVSVTGGSQVALPRSGSLKDQAIAAALNNPWAMGGSRYRRGAKSGPADTVYLGVFRRLQLIDAGGWNVHFSTNQDFELNQRMAKLGTVWFQEGLSVGYLPRRSVSELFWQYHRFGRWKAHYWNRLGERPQTRQMVLLAAPPVAAAVGLGALRLVLSRSTRMAWIAGVAGAALGCVAGPKRLAAWAINGIVGAGWWTGVVRGLRRDNVE